MDPARGSAERLGLSFLISHPSANPGLDPATGNRNGGARIVTELVINALNQAFPRHRKGVVHVEYRSAGPAWTLSMRDTGIGMPPDHARPGLGTGIVEALARQLAATVSVITTKPGTTVSIASE